MTDTTTRARELLARLTDIRGDAQNARQIREDNLSDEDREALAAISEALEGQAWQPIETALEDGTVILVYRPDSGVFTAHYVEEDAHSSNQMNPPEGDHYWFSTNGEDLSHDMPTHWMPLPSPPQEVR